MGKAYVERTYRNLTRSGDLASFTIKVKETDLYVAVDESLRPALDRLSSRLIETIRRNMSELERYIVRDPGFYVSLIPYEIMSDAPQVAKLMARAAALASVGPMAAVAGAFAEIAGHALLEDSRQVIVENGGDIFIQTSKERVVAIFAGESRFSNKIGILVKPSDTPVGICTSSGTVGPSLSLGEANAAVAIAKSAPLADAAATALGNMVRSDDDLEKALDFARKIPGIIGTVVVKGDSLGAWGQVELIEI